MDKIEQYIRSNEQWYQSSLFEFLEIPSVSAGTQYKADLLRAADWLEKFLAQLGFQSETIQTNGNPLVYAQTPPVPGGKTILFYGHYDVQPPDPLELWKTPPFKPTVRDGNVFARGATDDKGQFMTHLFAAEAILKNLDSPSVQLKFLFEGEEESCGSTSLTEYLSEQSNRDKLHCDCVVVSDSSMFGENQPAITYGLRGILAFELFIDGPNRDLHSGDFGGTVFNPGIALAKIIAGLIDEKGVIQVPGLYDDVLPISDLERELQAQLPFDEADFFEKIGVSQEFGEAGYTTLQRRWSRPTFDVNGITCGYQGEGSKTIVPSKASAKFTFRLVPNQNPDNVISCVRRRIAELVPPGVRMELKCEHGAPGMMIPLESPYIAAANEALTQVFGVESVFCRQGGSIPIVSQLKDRLNAEVLLIGWGQDDDNLHSPNEKFSLLNYQRGIQASAKLIQKIAVMS